MEVFMKKIIFIFVLLLSLSLNAITIYSDHIAEQTLVLDSLKHLSVVKFQTHRDKNGKVSDDEWEGYLLKEILSVYHIKQFDRLEINSTDNYQVKLTDEEISEHQPILAYKRNGKLLDESHLRVVSATLRDMYWATDIKSIKTIQQTVYPPVKTIYLFSTLHNQIALHNNPQPFTNIQGYFFKDLYSLAIQQVQLPVRIETHDGLIMELNYEQFLKNAVLIRNKDGKIDIKSPSMPGGMWPKHIFSLTFDETIILFDQPTDKIDETVIKTKFLSGDNAKINIIFNKKSKMIDKIEINR